MNAQRFGPNKNDPTRKKPIQRMGLRPEIFGIPLLKFIESTRADKELLKRAEAELNKQENEHNRELLDSVKKVLRDWVDATDDDDRKKEDDEGEVKGDEGDNEDEEEDCEQEHHIQAMIFLISDFLRRHTAECVFVDSNYYNGGGHFDTLGRHWRKHLDRVHRNMLDSLANGRPLIKPEAPMDVQWSSYSFLGYEHCVSLMNRLNCLWKEYQEAEKNGMLDLSEKDDSEDEDDDSEDEEKDDDDSDEEKEDKDQPKKKKARIERTFRKLNPAFLKELIPDLISWLKAITDKKLDLIMYTY